MGKHTLHFDNPRQLSQLYGGNEDNLRSIESKYGRQIVSRDGWLQVEGDDGVVEQVEAVLTCFKMLEIKALSFAKRISTASLTASAKAGNRSCVLYSMKPVS